MYLPTLLLAQVINREINIFADMDKLTLVLHSTKLVATKMDLPERNKLELSSVSIVQVEQLQVHGARCHGC